METIPGDIQVETLQEPPKTALQPPALEPPKAELNPLKDIAPPMDDAQIRAAIADAEAKGLDPMQLTMSDLDKKEAHQTETPPPEIKSNVEIPEKFKTTDGEVDVDKLKASTKQLEEAIQKKEEKLKTVEEAFQEYKVLEKKLSQTPNPEKLAATLEATPVVQQQVQSLGELKAKILQDLNTDPVGAITELIDIIASKKLEPISSDIARTREERHDNAIRQNIKALAEKDPRVLAYVPTINAKLEADPDLRRLKNPHRAAWLEIKEELRLGEPSGAQALPSKLPSPILGGGTPPSSPSSMGTQRPTLASLQNLDPRDKKQESMGDELVRSYFSSRR